MVSHETRESITCPVIPDPPCPIQRMKTCFRQFGRVANIMQISCRYQEITLVRRDYMRYASSLLPNLLHVSPPRS
jgi:hypothetical protein